MSRHNLSVVSSNSVEKARYVKCLADLSKVMDVVQSDVFDVKKPDPKIKNTLLDQVQKLVNDVGLRTVAEVLFRMMVVPFQMKESENPFAAKLIAYFYMLIADERWGEVACPATDGSPNDTVVSLNTSIASVADDGSDILPVWILKLCERYHDDARTMVRLRIMQTTEVLIPNRIEVSELRRTYQGKLIRMFNMRTKDKSEQIRTIAVRNLVHCLGEGLPFQPIISDTLIERMSYDPSHFVRAKIVSIIPITEDVVEYVVQRCGDPNTVVKVCALKRVGECIKLTDLSFEMRECILKENISEEAPKSVENAMSGLLQSWLKSLGDDIIEFLRILNVRKRKKLCQKTLTALFNQPPQEAYEKMSRILLNEKRYPEDSLCVESTFMWLHMYQRFKDDAYVFNKLTIPVVEMIDYIKEFMDVVEEEGDMPEVDFEYRGWMLGDLLEILVFLPVEEGERKAIVEFLPTICLMKKLMDQRNSVLVMKLISVCSARDDETVVIELVNHIMDSERPSMRESSSRSRRLSSPKPELEDTKDRLKLELGNLVHKKKKLEREREGYVRENDLSKAQSCQDEIVTLEEKINKVKESIGHHEEQANISSAPLDESMADVDDDNWTYSDKTLLIALCLIRSNIVYRNQVSNCTRTFYEMYAVKAVTKARDPKVRAVALELMCLVSLDFEGELARTTLFCLTALLRDSPSVKVAALKCLFDMVLVYSFAKIASYPQAQAVLFGSKELSTANPDNPEGTLKTLMLSYIRRDEVLLVRACVGGILKLLFRKSINSSRVITSLLINWAIPSHDCFVRFKDFGVVLPVYANVGETEAVEVARCLIGAIKKAIAKKHSRAESDQLTPSPDVDKIINFVVKCTDPKKLHEFQRCYIAHETIANAALQELLNVDLITEEKMHYVKVLKVLDLSKCPKESIHQMLHTLSDVAEHANRTINLTLKGFTTYLESLFGGKADKPTVEEEERVERDAFDSDSDNMDTTTV